MRISTGYQFDTYARSVARSQEAYVEAQRAVVTGRKLNVLRDDPFGTARSITMRSLRSASEQYAKNLDSAKSTLAMTESVLSDVYGVLRDAHQLALRGANGTSDQPAHASLARQVADLQKRLLELANTKGPSGGYLFAGQNAGEKPFSLQPDDGSVPTGGTPLPTGGYVVFSGDSLPVLVETGPNETLSVSVDGGQLFSDAYRRLDQVRLHLENGDLSSLGGDDLRDLQSSMDAVNTARASVGSRLQQVEQRQEMLQRRIDDLTVGLSDVEEVDLTEAIQRFKTAETAYQAALTVAAQGFKLSLMDFIQG
ncbi:MAG: flagellar hook-associated protein FlgL [Fimbriimonadales bacterium]|nr:flagellar hook-associated protein FlgL [Fimbriimonadales bacterium]